MRRSFVYAGAAVTLASLLACGDIFHSTDVPTLCDLDAAAPGCAQDGGAPPVVDLCAPDDPTAEARAAKACALLAACELPIGQNATGKCMVNAILAYNCRANPNRKPKLDAKVFWGCMQNANTCVDVDACVLPGGVQSCTGAGFVGCTDFAKNAATRLDCEAKGSPTRGENCAAYGQTCDAIDPDASNRNALCVGVKRRGCTASQCSGSNLVACDDAGVDQGLDCSLFGAGQCVTAGAVPACKPEGSSACAGTADITCTAGGEAQGCASGFAEQVDCNAISGAQACNPIPSAPPGTPVAAACARTSGCSKDTCSGADLSACVAGRVVTVRCASYGLGPCSDTIVSVEGTGAACTRP